MKFRNFLIVLLAILMAFVAVSCEDEPGDQVQPTPAAKDTIAKITVNKGIETSVWGNEKIQLEWNLGADSEGIQDGSVITLQFRTNRAPYEFDLRTNKKGVFLRDSEDTADKKQDVRWVYQESEDSLDSLSLGADGWYTLKYTFGEDAKSGTPDYDTYRYTNLGVQFKCLLMVGDVFEVKNVTLDGKALPLTDAINIGKHCSIEIGTDHDWTLPKTYVVVYALNGSWDGDDGTEAEIVAAGGKPTGIKAENGFTITYTDEDDELVVLSDLSIEEDTVINYTKVGDPRNVTFKVGDETFLATVVENGQNASKPATDPEMDGGYQFAAWCSDSGLTTEFNFATTPITADTILYAKFNKTWTVSFSLNGKAGTAPEAQTIVNGQTATKPADPKTSGFRFLKWTLDDEEFVFTTAIEADTTLVADWEVAPTVDFTYNLNYDGAPAAESVPTYIGEAASSTRPDDPSRLGYDFVGWFDAATDGTEYPFTEIVEEGGEKTLYAYWTHKSVTKMVAVKGVNDGLYSYDKFSFNFGFGPALGDKVSILFRSNRPIDEFNIRDPREGGDKATGYRWVYGKDGEDAFGANYVVDDDTGWISFTYEFGAKAQRTDKASGEVDVDYENYVTGLYVQFVGTLIAGDYLEIGDIQFNGVSVESVSALIEHSYVLKNCEDSAITTIEYSADKPAVTYVVQFLDPADLDSDKNPKGAATAVASGATVTAPTEGKWAAVLEWNTAKDGSGEAWDFSSAITSDKKLYAIWE